MSKEANYILWQKLSIWRFSIYDEKCQLTPIREVNESCNLNVCAQAQNLFFEGNFISLCITKCRYKIRTCDKQVLILHTSCGTFKGDLKKFYLNLWCNPKR